MKYGASAERNRHITFVKTVSWLKLKTMQELMNVLSRYFKSVRLQHRPMSS